MKREEFERRLNEKYPTGTESTHANKWNNDRQEGAKWAFELLSLPPAEGAEEILEKHMKLSSIQPINGGYPLHVVKIAMQEFATLHARKMAEEMVKEKCKKCKYRALPDSIQEALNSGDGVYRP